jgi:hypothetical protein
MDNPPCIDYVPIEKPAFLMGISGSWQLEVTSDVQETIGKNISRNRQKET